MATIAVCALAGTAARAASVEVKLHQADGAPLQDAVLVVYAREPGTSRTPAPATMDQLESGRPARRLFGNPRRREETAELTLQWRF